MGVELAEEACGRQAFLLAQDLSGWAETIEREDS